MDIDQPSSQRDPVRSVEGWIILITGLHEETSEEDIQDEFADYGVIKNLHLNLDRRSGYVKGYAFVEYAHKEEADKAIEAANGATLLGQKITVDYAFVTPPPDSETNGTVGEERDRSRSPQRKD